MIGRDNDTVSRLSHEHCHIVPKNDKNCSVGHSHTTDAEIRPLTIIAKMLYIV